MLENWNNYLSIDDINIIKSFINDSINNVKRDKALVLYGTGSNGKTTMINEIIQLIGADKCHKMNDIQNIRGNSAEFANCCDKTLIAIDGYNFINNHLFKQLIGGDDYIYRKLYGDDKRVKTHHNIILTTCVDPVNLFEKAAYGRCDIINFSHKF